MRIVHRDVQLKRKTVFTIRHITDVHMGSDGHYASLLERFIDIQKNDPNSVWICTGDLLDADRPSTRQRKNIMYSDRPDALTQEDEKVLAWLDTKVIPKFMPIAKSCIGILDGDHYIKLGNGMTSGQYICSKLGVQYLGERMAYVGLIFRLFGGNLSYTIMARHGRSAGRTIGSDCNAMETQNRGFIADLYLGGHTHKEAVFPQFLLYPNRLYTSIVKKIVWYCRGGSFLRGYMPGKELYPEIAEYSPLCTGWGEIKLTIGSNRERNRNMDIIDSTGSIVAS